MSFTSANAREPYHKRIHGLLKKYHQSTILKELLQNADDAGATEFKIKYDTNSYSTDQLISDSDDLKMDDLKKENLKKMQGPSLLIFNNSSFKEKDWQGIMSLGSGSKENDFKSVGKFGLGVNSVYHVSDYLTIVSDRTLFIQDPLQKISEDGIMGNYIEQSLDQLYPGSTQPFKHFGCDMVQPFNGTIIRLPIRTEGGLIKLDPIKDYDEIFNDFITQLKELLIFLKNISVVEVYMDNVMKFKVSISNNDEIYGERALVHDYVSQIANSMETCNFADFIEIIKSKDDLPLCTFKMNLDYFTTVNGSVELSGTSSYLITQGLVKDGLEEFDIKRFTTKLIPWGGVAVPIGLSDEERINFKGIPFTFLPIGTLRFDNPFHINGFFVLSDARTDIPFSLTMLESSEEYFDSLWNKFIITHIIPVLYSSNIEHMTKEDMGLEPNQIYSFFPRSEYTNSTDKLLSSEILKRLVDCKTFQSVHTLNYFTLADCHCITNQDKNISDVLHERGYAVVKIPDKLLNYLEEQNLIVNFVTPQFVCNILKHQPLQEFNLSILDYLMDHTLVLGGHLHNVKIFPMADGSVGSVSTNRLNQIYYPDKNQFSLLEPRFSKLLISKSIIDINQMKDTYFNRLTRKYNVSYMDHTTFIRSLKDSFKEMVGENIILHELPLDFKSDIFWEYMSNKDVSPIDNLACIPVSHKNSFQSSQFYIPPCHRRMLLDLSLCDPIRSIAFNLGFYILRNKQLSKAISHVDSYSNFLSELTCEMVLDQVAEVKNGIRKYLISNTSSKLGSTKRSTEHSIKIFSLPLFNNSKCGFSSIQRGTKCAKWKDISKFSSEEFIIFEEDENSLCNWPTVILPKGEIILQFILPHMESYSREVQFSIVKLLLKETSIYRDHRIRYIEWIPNENGTLSNIEDVFILSEFEERLLQYTPKGKSQIIAYHLMDLKKQWLEIGVKSYYKDRTSGYYLVKDCMESLSNQKDLDIVKNAIPLIGNFIVSKGLRNPELFNIPFIPVKMNHPFRLNEPSIDFVSVSNCYLNLELCFSVATIGDVDPKVLYHFEQFLPTISVKLVKDHLINLIDMHRDRQTASTFSEDDIKTMNETMEKIYKYFDSNCHKIDESSFADIDWIWNGNKFISPTRVFKNGKSVDPYIFELPQYLKKFNNLIAITNIPNEPTYDHYLNILEEIYEISQGLVLSNEQFGIVISTINALSEMKRPKQSGTLYLPTIKRILVESNKIIFSESDIVHQSLKSFSILHRDISLNIAKKLHIKSSMDAIRSGKPFGSDFGQHEDLVQRIKSINLEYKIESFLKEMVQNAEDCGATKLEICFDKRRYAVTEEDIDLPSKFRDYLEPSIVIYNDKMFTEQDIHNIQSLGASYKRTDNCKIGQYGIGFNSVYNFTDVPSIITRNSLYIFDPLKLHFSVELSPGRLYDFNLKDQLTDTFKPLNYPNFDLLLDTEYTNTIIRLPLRKSVSELSSNIWNFSLIETLMKKFQENAENCLLFQKSLKMIRFSVIEDDGTNQSKELYIVERKVKDGFDPTVLNHYINNFNWLGKTSVFFYFIDIIKDNAQEENWFIGWRIGCDYKEKIYHVYKGLKDSKVVPWGSIAICLSKGIKGIPFTYLPLPKSTELPVHINGSFILNSARQDVFNSLENDIVLNVKDYIEPGSEKEKSYWNIAIVEEILSPLYLDMLNNNEFKSNFKESKIDEFYSLFPNSNTTLWNRITDYFYKNVSNYSIFSKLITFNSYGWTSLKLNALVILSNYQEKLDNIEIIKILLQDKCNLILIPKKVYDLLPRQEYLNIFDPYHVSKFYKVIENGFTLSSPPKPSLSSKDNILSLAKYLSGHINDTPLMLLQNETKCLVFKLQESPEKHWFHENYYNLLPTLGDDLFIHRDLCSLNINIQRQLPFQNGYVLDLSFPDFFVKYLVKQLQTFSNYDQCLKILKSLKDNWKKFNLFAIEDLSNCLIVPVLNNHNEISKFNPVSKYYSKEVLKLVQPKYNLPPIFNDDEFQPILEKLKIRKSPKLSKIQKEFLSLNSEPDEDKFDKLYQYLEQNFNYIDILNLLNNIQELNIIPCQQIDRIGALVLDFPYSSLSRSSDISCQDYCYTVLPIRKRHFEVTRPTQLPDEIVVQHLFKLFDSAKEWEMKGKLNEFSDLLIKVMDRILESTQYPIKPLPIDSVFPIGSELVSIKDIILTSENLRPFFYTIPTDFKKYRSILIKLGFSSLTDDIIIKKLADFKNQRFSQNCIDTLISILNQLVQPSPILPDNGFSTILLLESLNIYKGTLVSKFTIISNGQDVTKSSNGSDFIYDRETNSIYIDTHCFEQPYFFIFINQIFGYDISFLYEKVKDDYDINPMRQYSAGEETRYSNDGANFESVTIIQLNEESERYFSELKFYFVQHGNRIVSVPSVHLYANHQTDINSIDIQSILHLNDEVLSNFGNGHEVERIRKLALKLNIVLPLSVTTDIQKIENFYFKSLFNSKFKSKYSSENIDINLAQMYKDESKIDLDAAICLFRNGFYSRSCFFIQQSLEKLFKGYCFKKGISIDSNKNTLLWRHVKENIDCSDAQIIEQYFYSTRYPSIQEEKLISSIHNFTLEQAKKAINIGQNIYDKLDHLI